MKRLDTAYEHWDKQWQITEERERWSQAESRVLHWSSHCFNKKGMKALDLGCGVGRHAIALSSQGFIVDALDASQNALKQTQEYAEDLGVVVATQQGSMLALPFADNSFDYVVSWNVIYHGDEAIVRQVIKEICRVLKKGGIYQGTMLSKRNDQCGIGEEVAKDTWINNGKTDKAHPHFYCDAKTLLNLFDQFEVFLLEDYEQKPGAYHWHLVLEKNH